MLQVSLEVPRRMARKMRPEVVQGLDKRLMAALIDNRWVVVLSLLRNAFRYALPASFRHTLTKDPLEVGRADHESSKRFCFRLFRVEHLQDFQFSDACDDDGEVASSPLSRADADVALRCCEAGATLELPSLVKLGVARLRSVRGATSPPTGRRRLARNIQESDNSRLIDTRASAFYWNFTLRGDGVVMIARVSPRRCE